MRIALLLGSLSLFLLTSCHEPHNPMMGSWQHSGLDDSGAGEVVIFTPSTMIIGEQRVTVVYQVRQDQVRVSAGKHAIIYDLVDENTISYKDDSKRLVTLRRLSDSQ